MSKKIAEIEAEERNLEDERRAIEKKIGLLAKKTAALKAQWPFRCKKCKTAFKMSEAAVMDYEVRETKMKCQYGGDYDTWQEVIHKSVAVCPICGKSFGALVDYPQYISGTEKYSRWDDKPDFSDCYTKKLLKKPRKMDSCNLKFLKSHWREAGC